MVSVEYCFMGNIVCWCLAGLPRVPSYRSAPRRQPAYFGFFFNVQRDNLLLQTRGNPSGCTVSTPARSSASSN